MQGPNISTPAAVPLLSEAKFDVTLTAAHVPGRNNKAADDISRNNMVSLFALVPQARQDPSPIPRGLVERLVTSSSWTSDDWRSWLETLSTEH